MYKRQFHEIKDSIRLSSSLRLCKRDERICNFFFLSLFYYLFMRQSDDEEALRAIKRERKEERKKKSELWRAHNCVNDDDKQGVKTMARRGCCTMTSLKENVYSFNCILSYLDVRWHKRNKEGREDR